MQWLCKTREDGFQEKFEPGRTAERSFGESWRAFVSPDYARILSIRETNSRGLLCR